MIFGQNRKVGATIPVPGVPEGIDVNPVTNKIYLAVGQNGPPFGAVLVIDGQTNAITASIMVLDPNDIAVDSATNIIYASNTSGQVYVIDGSTNIVTAIITPPQFVGDVFVGCTLNLEVNPATDMVYFSGQPENTATQTLGPSSVWVISGQTNTVTDTIPDPGEPCGIGVNPVTNTIYVANDGGGNILIINGSTNSATTLTNPSGSGTADVTVNPKTNKIYMTEIDINEVLVIAG
jgi:DNA-binding beta-propeller fold protein YncE